MAAKIMAAKWRQRNLAAASCRKYSESEKAAWHQQQRNAKA